MIVDSLMHIIMTDLRQDEGYRQRVYDDATGETIVPGYTVIGNPTIAFGRNLLDPGVSKAEGDILLRNDIIRAMDALQRKFPESASLSNNRYQVLVNMVVNMGISRFLGFEKMIAAIIAGDWERAGVELMDSDAGRELPARYGRLKSLLIKG